MRLITLTEIKIFLEKADTAHDSLLSLFIEKVSKRIETYLNRKFTKASYTEYFNCGKRRYFLSAVPVSDNPPPLVTHLNSTLTENSDYYIWYDEGIIEFTSPVLSLIPKSLKCVYTGGYASDATSDVLKVPDDIKYACILQVAADFRNRDNLGLQSINLPNGSMAIAANELLPSVKQILKQYRLSPNES